MFETILQRILSAIGASDQVIAASGPSACFIIGMLFGLFFAQIVKYPISLVVNDGRGFDWLVRVVSIVSGTLFAHGLGNSLNWWWAFGAGVSAWGFYHLSLVVIRRKWPWLEMNLLVGAISPAPEAKQSAAQREADKAGESSGV